MTPETKLNVFFNRHAITPHQRRIVRYMLDGLSNEEIAIEMNTTSRTIKNCAHLIYDKVGKRSRLKLVVYLYKEIMGC